MLPDYHYVSFDSPETRLFWMDDPSGALNSLKGGVIFDEAQKFPALFEYLKIAVDQDPTAGRFVLIGSAQFMLLQSISESLAGRCGFQSLLPFERAEVPHVSVAKAELFGWYPELVTRDWAMSREWYDGYLTSYLERDVRSLLNIGNLADFHRVVGLLAVRTGQEFNAASISKEAGVSEKTVVAWLSVLEASYIIFLLKPWHRNLGKRLVKRPKVYFWDTGLVCALSGIRTQEALSQGPLAGALFENLVLADRAKAIAHRGLDQNLYYLRANGGLEVDFILEDVARQVVTVGEIQRRETVRADDTRHIRTVLGLPGLLPSMQWQATGLVVTQGENRDTLPGGIAVDGFGS